MSSPTRKELLSLYKKILRSASTYPSIKRDAIYQAIREEWRVHAHTTDPDILQRQISIAYKGLTQLRQFDVETMTGGNVHSNTWSVQLEQNPMPKPPDYEERKKREKERRANFSTTEMMLSRNEKSDALFNTYLDRAWARLEEMRKGSKEG
jgi:hypothetical protein